MAIKQQPLDDAAVRAALAGAGDRDAIEIEQQRVAEHRLTYDDLPRLAELILQDKSVADLYRCLFACVLVDEFQDLTPQLLRMIRHIGQGRTTYAGDIAQAIYGFAGAAPTQILQEIQQETGGNAIVFADSHRSSPGRAGAWSTPSPRSPGDSSCAAPIPAAGPAVACPGWRPFPAQPQRPSTHAVSRPRCSRKLPVNGSASSPGRPRGAGSPTPRSSSRPCRGTGGTTRSWTPRPPRS